MYPTKSVTKFLIAVSVLLLNTIAAQKAFAAPYSWLVASPNPVPAGGNTTLYWGSSETISCGLFTSDVNGYPLNWLAFGISGQYTTALSTQTKFGLGCTPVGQAYPPNQYVTVTTTAPGPTVDISASPASVQSGNSTTLNWTSSNASSCAVYKGTFWSAENTLSYALSGSISSGPITPGNTTFSIVCNPLSGSSSGQSMKTTTVTITAPAALSLTTAASSVPIGGSTTLSWTSANMSACILTKASNQIIGSGTSGSSVSTGVLTTNQTFTLTCYPSNGSSAVTDSKTVSIALPVVDTPDPAYPNVQSSDPGSSFYLSNGDIYVGTKPEEDGAAITSVIRGGFEYVQNDPVPNPGGPDLRRGGSWQGTFFFDSPFALDAQEQNLSYRSYYNDCNNPLETGAVADFNTPNKGRTSPTYIHKTPANTLQSSANLVYYISPLNGFIVQRYLVLANGLVPKGEFTQCDSRYTNVPKTFTTPDTNNNDALSPVFLGKNVTLSNIGTATVPKNIPGVIAVDMVLATDKQYNYNALYPGFASIPTTLSVYKSYNPKTQTLTTLTTSSDTPVAVRDVSIAQTPDGAHAVAVYTPQISPSTENPLLSSGYVSTAHSNNVNTLTSYIRVDAMPAGSYKFKSYYIVGSFAEVKAAIDQLYEYFNILDPRVFNWQYYVSTNGLGSMSEDQARLHWLTTGIKLGLASHPNFSVQSYLAGNTALQQTYGTNYYAVVKQYLFTH